jgi:hypothetical protein
MYDPIFYPDRTPAEAARLNREGAEFFESVVRRRVDPIFYPDRTPEEALELHREAADFFETVIQRKSAR